MPGIAVGIYVGGAQAEVAVAVGGNAVMLYDREGFERDLPTPPLNDPPEAWQSLFEGARLRAERALARPVTHAVLAVPSNLQPEAIERLDAARRRPPVSTCCASSGVTTSRPARRRRWPLAVLAEDLAPRPAESFTADLDSFMPKMTFIERDGTRREVDAPLGLSVLEIAHRNEIDIEGACEGSLACSTCHVIVDPEWYELLKEASEDEEDMLDLAFGLTATSRLGCQIIITEELDGLTSSFRPARATCCSVEPRFWR